MKSKIIKSALRQIHKYGFRKFTIDEIAEDLGISKKTVYKYFASKNLLISKVVDFKVRMEKERTLKTIKGNGSWLEKFDKVVLGQAETEIPKDHLILELRQYFPDEWEKTKELRQFKKEQVKDLLQEGKRQGEIRTDVDLETIVFVMDVTFNRLISLYFEREQEINLSQTLREVKKLILFGILSDNRETRGENSNEETFSFTN